MDSSSGLGDFLKLHIVSLQYTVSIIHIFSILQIHDIEALMIMVVNGIERRAGDIFFIKLNTIINSILSSVIVFLCAWKQSPFPNKSSVFVAAVTDNKVCRCYTVHFSGGGNSAGNHVTFTHQWPFTDILIHTSCKHTGCTHTSHTGKLHTNTQKSLSAWAPSVDKITFRHRVVAEVRLSWGQKKT